VFIGHAAAGFAAKRLAPRTSLAWLLVAPWLLDFLWPVFLVLGIERVRPRAAASPFLNLDFVSYPWPHSLLMAVVWAVVFGFAYERVTRDRRGALVVGALVVSHWLIDLVVHVPDLPLWPGPSPLYGLGLWRLPAYTMFVEGLLFVSGLAVYVACTRPRERTGNLALGGLVAFLLGIYWLSLSGGPPPSHLAIAGTMLVFGAVLVPWAAWIDRHRAAAPEQDQSRML